MKIKIIFPTHLDDQKNPVRTRAKEGKILNLSFIYLAGLTPSAHEVAVIDEIFEEIDFEDPVDLVAITAMTSQAGRAYQISEAFRRRGVKVVMGGFHATFMPTEACRHVDAIVLGEAEGVWETLLEDVQKGELKKIYQRKTRTASLGGLPVPRYDLIAKKRQEYKYYPVWVGRGCPHNCDFCTVNKFYGTRVRTRPVDDVIRDIRYIPSKRLMFVDDNLFTHKKYLKELLPRVAACRREWLAQLDPGAGEDEQLLDMAQEAGMQTAYIGFEYFSQQGLAKINKNWVRSDSYTRLINNLHKRGITIFASMMLGVEKESPETIRKILRRLEALKIDELALYILTPVPGSRMWEQQRMQPTALSNDWSFYDGTHAVFTPPGMAQEELEALYWSLYQMFYSRRSILKRFFRRPYHLRNWLLSMLRNMLVYRVDVNAGRSVHSNPFSPLEALPAFRYFYSRSRPR